jgi:hypothetical protein
MTPKLTLTGSSGNYQIQRSQVLGVTTNWVAMTSIYLADTPYILYDDAAIGAGQPYDRAVEQTPAQLHRYPLRLRPRLARFSTGRVWDDPAKCSPRYPQ